MSEPQAGGKVASGISRGRGSGARREELGSVASRYQRSPVAEAMMAGPDLFSFTAVVRRSVTNAGLVCHSGGRNGALLPALMKIFCLYLEKPRYSMRPALPCAGRCGRKQQINRAMALCVSSAKISRCDERQLHRPFCRVHYKARHDASPSPVVCLPKKKITIGEGSMPGTPVTGHDNIWPFLVGHIRLVPVERVNHRARASLPPNRTNNRRVFPEA